MGMHQIMGGATPRGAHMMLSAMPDPSASCAVGTGDGIASRAVGWTTLNLRAGRYELVCHLPNRYADGMWQEFDIGRPGIDTTPGDVTSTQPAPTTFSSSRRPTTEATDSPSNKSADYFPHPTCCTLDAGVERGRHAGERWGQWRASRGRPRRYGLHRRRGRCSGDHSPTTCLRRVVVLLTARLNDRPAQRARRQSLQTPLGS